MQGHRNQQVKDLTGTIKIAQAPNIEQVSGCAPKKGGIGNVHNTRCRSYPMRNCRDETAGARPGTGGSEEVSAGATGVVMPGMMGKSHMQVLSNAASGGFERLLLQLAVTHSGARSSQASQESGAVTPRPLLWRRRSRPVRRPMSPRGGYRCRPLSSRRRHPAVKWPVSCRWSR